MRARHGAPAPAPARQARTAPPAGAARTISPAGAARLSGGRPSVVIAALLLLGLWTSPAAAQAAGEEQAPTTAVAAPDVPDDVIEWFLEAGAQVAINQSIQRLGLDHETAATAEFGAIRSVMTWSESYIEATSLMEPVVPTDQWIAPVVRPLDTAPDDEADGDDDADADGDGDGEGELVLEETDDPNAAQTETPRDPAGTADEQSPPQGSRTSDESGNLDGDVAVEGREVPTDSGNGADSDSEAAGDAEDGGPSYEYLGVLQADRVENGGVRLRDFTPGVELAGELADLDLNATIVFDEELDAWFAILDGLVEPVDLAARENLAGSIALRDYQPFVAERHAIGAESSSENGGEGSRVPAIWTAGIISSLLLLTAAIVWLRKVD